MEIARHYNLKIFLFFLFYCCQPSLAQTNFSVSYIGIEQGLSNNSVTAIYQDRYGFMWFGTYDGLNRYDGSGFKIFRNHPEDSTSLINNRIVAISEDHDDNLWIGTKNGICQLDQRTFIFSPVMYLPWQKNKTLKLNSTVNDIETDKEGNVFIATAGLGLMCYTKKQGHAIQLPLYSGSVLKLSYHVQSIKFDAHGKAWLFVQGEGLCFYNIQKNCVEPVNATVTHGTCLLPDNMGHIWVGSENGLYQYTVNSKVSTSFSHKLTNTTVVDLFIDKKQNLWVATDGGGITIVNLLSGKAERFLQGEDKNSLTSGAVFAIYEDSHNRKWIGTLRGGVNMVDPQKNKFKNISHNPLNQNSLLNDFILSFREDEAHNLWIGTDGEGLSYWNRSKNKYTNFVHTTNPSSLSNNNVSQIVRDYENNIWVSTYGGGVCLYNKKNQSFKRYPCYNTTYQYEDRNVWSLYEDSDHILWAGTCSGGGLYRLNRVTDRFELFDVGVTNVITLTQDHEGNLWAGTFSDLIKIDKINRKHVLHHINYPVRTIYEDEKNTLWVGTEGSGLRALNLKTNVFRHFTEENGLPNNSVLNILADHSGFLWLSTYNGLSRLDPSTGRIKNFFESDGLPSNQFNYNAAAHLTSGEFIFGGIKGFTFFSPDSIKDAAGFPGMVLTGLRVNNTSIEKDSTYTGKANVNALHQLTLPYDKAVLSVDYSALEYSAPDKISYAYFLEGWDNDWNYPGKVKTANYSKLREGTYTLRLKSTNSDNIWNNDERVLTITVLPPWYRSWWAYTLYGMGILLLFAFYSHYQSNQAKLKYEIKIAHINAEKEKELNEKKLEFFTNISHEFRSPLTLIINPAKELLYSTNKEIGMEDVTIIYRNAKRLLSLVDQLLLFRKAEIEDELKIVRLNFSNLCKEVFLCFAHQAASKKIHYELKCNNENLELFVDREKIEIALLNLFSNALKFTPEGGIVTVNIDESVEAVEVCVSDSGCGIPTESSNQIFDKFYQVYNNKKTSKGGFGIGLYLVKKFIENHKGEIHLESKINEGTTFSIKLWKGREHFNGAFIFEDVEESSIYLEELVEDTPLEPLHTKKGPQPGAIVEDVLSDKKSMLIVDDNDQIRHYIRQMFTESFTILEADNAEDAFKIVQESVPDIIISDVLMKGKSGIEFCSQVKEDPSLNHIPVILLTASSSSEIKLKGLEGGADDYITKPFDKELLIARITGILKSRNNLKKYFYNEVTLQSNNLNISQEYKAFLSKCIGIIEKHLEDTDFNIKIFAAEMGMSHSNLYKKIKFISEQSATEFIRFIRLRKAAELMINTNLNVSEVAFKVGFNDLKYFREQFIKLFEMKPSEYIRKFRNTLQKNYKFTEKKSHG